MPDALPPEVARWMPEPVSGAGPLGVRLIEGQSAPVVLFQGLGRVAATWWPLVAAAAGRLTLILPDNPGIGRSRALPVPRTIEEHAALHEATLEACGVPPPWHVAGLSLGGMVAIALAARLGARAASLTILAASCVETGLLRLDPRALLRIGLRVLRYRACDHRVSIGELVRPEIRRRNPDLAGLWDRVQAHEGFRLPIGLRQLLAAARFRLAPYAGRLPARQVVVVGDADRLVPCGHSHRLAARLDAPLVTIPGGGHDMSSDCPEAVAGILEAMAAGRPLEGGAWRARGEAPAAEDAAGATAPQG